MEMCYLACAYRTPSRYCGSTGGVATCPHRQKKPSNADRIRAKDDEELAKWIYDVSITDDFCPYGNTREPCITHNFECVPCIKDWLKAEVNDAESV
jgi:hypothetical protein